MHLVTALLLAKDREGRRASCLRHHNSDAPKNAESAQPTQRRGHPQRRQPRSTQSPRESLNNPDVKPGIDLILEQFTFGVPPQMA